MSTKQKRESGKVGKRERACRRCGCTEKNACPGGCSWVGQADICTACLTSWESILFQELDNNLTCADNGCCAARSMLQHAKLQLRLFSRVLEEGKQRR